MPDSVGTMCNSPRCSVYGVWPPRVAYIHSPEIKTSDLTGLEPPRLEGTLLGKEHSAYDIDRVESCEKKAHQFHAPTDLGDSPLSSAASPVT
jgi:hypothetical protein